MNANNNNNNNKSSNGDNNNVTSCSIMKKEQRGTFLVIEKSSVPNDTTTHNINGNGNDNNVNTNANAKVNPPPKYIHCNSKSDFILPTSNNGDGNNNNNNNNMMVDEATKQQLLKVKLSTSSSSTSPSSKSSTYTPEYCKKVNSTLNLHLGLFQNGNDPRNIKTILLIAKLLSFFLGLIENGLFKAWGSLPLSLRQKISIKAWKIYYPIHAYVLKNKTAIHPDASYEYHAMTSILYWGRLFPVTIKRMRFSLSQLCCCHGLDTYPLTVDNVSCLGYTNHGISGTGDSGTSGSDSGSSDSEKGMLMVTNNNKVNEYGLKSTYVHAIKYDMKKHCLKHYQQQQSATSKTTISKTTTSTVPVEQLPQLPIPFMRKNAPKCTNSDETNKNDPSHVTGYFIQHNSKPSTKVILWLYGGAYLSGDSKGNLNFAEKIGQQCANTSANSSANSGNFTDVFLPDYRLLPEYTFFDALYDVCLAYEYLITVQDYKPEDVMLFGISSGGGLIVKLLQRIVELKNEKEESRKNENGSGSGITSTVTTSTKSRSTYDDEKRKRLETVPSGAVLMCPFVDYTGPEGSFTEYSKHDLIVSDSVMEEGLQYLQTLGSDENARRESPVYNSMKGLPPLCIITSEHECVYDQNILLCNNARKDGVEVDLALWKYMCHVWPVWSGFLPEARQAVDFMCDWIKETCSN